MSLFNEMESCADPDAHEPDLVEVEKHLRKRKYAGQREKLIKDIPRSKVLHTIDEREQICEKCGSAMAKVGEEFVRTEVQFIPASLKVTDHYRETYECRACRKNGTPYREKSPVPHPPVMHSLASASTIAWLIHQKFELGIPLYRQEKEWEALGLSLSRATMSNWLLCVCRDRLSHVAGRLRQELLKQEYLHIDETHVQVLKEPGRKNTSDSYMWVYCSIRDCKQPVRYFALTVVRLNKLFEIEKELEGLDPEQKKKERIDREKPLLEAFWSWAEIHSAGELPKSKLHTAFQYALNNRQEFFNYLEDGNCSISNSLAENCIRPL